MCIDLQEHIDQKKFLIETQLNCNCKILFFLKTLKHYITMRWLILFNFLVNYKKQVFII